MVKKVVEERVSRVDSAMPRITRQQNPVGLVLMAQ